MKRALAAAGVVALLGCQTPMAQLRKDLGPDASEALKCPESELRFKELEHVISATKVQVTGCGREAVYELVESRWQRQARKRPDPLTN